MATSRKLSAAKLVGAKGATESMVATATAPIATASRLEVAVAAIAVATAVVLISALLLSVPGAQKAWAADGALAANGEMQTQASKYMVWNAEGGVHL